MRLRLHIVHEADPLLMRRLDSLYIQGEHVQTMLRTILSQQESMMATLDETLQAVNDESTQEDSIVALLQQLREQIAGVTSGTLPTDVQAKVDAIFAKLQGNSKKLADAINANGTPATPGAPK